jgi:hypothetical protein
MDKELSVLRKRFLSNVENNWELNNHDLKNISCVYVMVGFDFENNKRHNFLIDISLTIFHF